MKLWILLLLVIGTDCNIIASRGRSADEKVGISIGHRRKELEHHYHGHGRNRRLRKGYVGDVVYMELLCVGMVMDETLVASDF